MQTQDFFGAAADDDNNDDDDKKEFFRRKKFGLGFGGDHEPTNTEKVEKAFQLLQLLFKFLHSALGKIENELVEPQMDRQKRKKDIERTTNT